MAITDVLRGLIGGAGGALAGYGMQQQREQERREREEERNRLERIRMEERKERAAEAAEARKLQLAIAGFTPSTEAEAMGEPIAARAPELGRLLEEFGPTQIAAPGAIPAPRTRSDIASALAVDTKDGRMDSGATVAPNQTYSAIDRALAEAGQPSPAPDRARVVMERGPEPQALRGPSARERGMDLLEVDGRFYTRPGERMLAEEKAKRDLETEEALARIKAEIEREKLQQAVQNVIAVGKRRGVDLTPEEAMAVVENSISFDALVKKTTGLEDVYPGITTLRRGIDAYIRRGTEDVIPSPYPGQPPTKIERPYTAKETVDYLEEESRLFGIPVEILYPDYGMIKESLRPRTPEETQSARARFDASRGLSGLNVGEDQSTLIDSELADELELLFDQDAMAPRLNETTAGQQSSRRNFASDNYLVR